MVDYTYIQSDTFALPVRDRKEMLLLNATTFATNTILEISKTEHFMFPTPLKFNANFIEDVAISVINLIGKIKEANYEPVIVGLGEDLFKSIKMRRNKSSNQMEWYAEFVVVGLR